MSEGLVEGQGDASVLEEGHGILCARRGESRERKRERETAEGGLARHSQGIHKCLGAQEAYVVPRTRLKPLRLSQVSRL